MKTTRVPDPLGSALFLEAGSGSAFKSQFRTFRGSKMELWRAVDAQNGGPEGLRPVVADSHHLDEEQDPDPH
jgi:hypothetical protein